MVDQLQTQETVSDLIGAVDLFNPLLRHHHRRVAVIAYHIGKAYGLSEDSLTDLTMAASLHDIGAMTVEEVEELRYYDLHDPRPHELLGAYMLSAFSPFEGVCQIIRQHHVVYEHDGMEEGEKGILPYILHLADRVENLLNRDWMALNQRDRVLEQIHEMEGSIFPSAATEAFDKAAKKDVLWFEIDELRIDQLVGRLGISKFSQSMTKELFEELLTAFSRVVDCRSVYTVGHSVMVSAVAEQLAKKAGLAEDLCYKLKVIGFLHDIGKIAIPAEVVASPGKLTAEEYNTVKYHPYFTYQIMTSIRGFRQLAIWAASHHERRDQTGYPGIRGDGDLILEEEILIYADLYSALAEDRAYRSGKSYQELMITLEESFVPSVGIKGYELLKALGEPLYKMIRELKEKNLKEYEANTIAVEAPAILREHYLKKELYSLVRRDKNIFDFIQKGSLDGMWYWDLEKPEHEWMSNDFWNTLGYDPEKMKHLASEWQDIIYQEDLDKALDNFNKHCEDPSHPYDQIVRYVHKDGSTVWIRCRGVAIRDYAGKPIRMLGAHTDITELKELQLSLEEKNRELEQKQMEVMELNRNLTEMATRDYLTGLHNRQMIDRMLIDEKKKADEGVSEFAVLMMDINRFKSINDVYGHLFGDKVLMDFARRLKGMLRSSDMISRWGGDEFLVLLPGTDGRSAEDLAKKIRQGQGEWHVSFKGEKVAYSVGVGYSVFRKGESIEDCVHRADQHLYENKCR